MNYIKHLTKFLEIVYHDQRLTPHHISLYIALFHSWNDNRFENPFKIIRSEILRSSKIGSINTYHKCLHELHQFGYIIYQPSYHPLQGSCIHLIEFDTGMGYETRLKTIQHIPVTRLKNGSGERTGNESIYKENTKNIQKKRKTYAIPEKNDIPPKPDIVQQYFLEMGCTETEAKKFCNHFQSNGWKVGGKAPMKDWQAAARNWMLNCEKYSKPVNKGLVQLSGKKNYGEPL